MQRRFFELTLAFGALIYYSGPVAGQAVSSADVNIVSLNGSPPSASSFVCEAVINNQKRLRSYRRHAPAASGRKGRRKGAGRARSLHAATQRLLHRGHGVQSRASAAGTDRAANRSGYDDGVDRRAELSADLRRFHLQHRRRHRQEEHRAGCGNLDRTISGFSA
jgi:hypothetical protein